MATYVTVTLATSGRSVQVDHSQIRERERAADNIDLKSNNLNGKH